MLHCFILSNYSFWGTLSLKISVWKKQDARYSRGNDVILSKDIFFFPFTNLLSRNNNRVHSDDEWWMYIFLFFNFQKQPSFANEPLCSNHHLWCQRTKEKPSRWADPHIRKAWFHFCYGLCRVRIRCLAFFSLFCHLASSSSSSQVRDAVLYLSPNITNWCSG